MRITFTILLSLFALTIFAQSSSEQQIETEVKDVTVFLSGAQITRRSTVNASKGVSEIRFVKLSPYIDAKSLQVRALGDITVLNVSHNQNYIDNIDESEEMIELKSQLKDGQRKLKLAKADLSVVKSKIEFLNENRVLSGKSEQVTLINLKQTAEYYGKELGELKSKEIDLDIKISDMERELRYISNQIGTYSRERSQECSGEVVVKLDATTGGSFPIEISYLVHNASWTPSYDLRAEGVDTPMKLVYKADIAQNTGVEWEKVNLRLSSANPNVSGVAPKLDPYFINAVSYKIPPPPPAPQVIRTLTIVEDDVELDDELEMSYEEVEYTSSRMLSKSARSKPLSVQSNNNQTTFDFSIDRPYSVKSDYNHYTVAMKTIDLPATYQYYAVPKIDKDPFLIANIVDWEQHNLLDGPANIFFENTYVGESQLNLTAATDTLLISLGRDKQISVSREKQVEFSKSRTFGTKREDSRAWKTVVRNGKSDKIDMVIIDQVPVSRSKDIEVIIESIASGDHNLKSGEVKWKFILEPKESREFDLIYKVKYPKSVRVLLE